MAGWNDLYTAIIFSLYVDGDYDLEFIPEKLTLEHFKFWAENDWNNTDFDEFLKPIPITIDILEKNGFELNKKQSECMRNIYDGNIMLFNFPLCKGFYIEWDIEEDIGMITDHCFIKFKYVHELQQVLRLCKIEKEIE